MQSELDSLANVKTTAVANKASKQQQIVSFVDPVNQELADMTSLKRTTRSVSPKPISHRSHQSMRR